MNKEKSLGERLVKARKEKGLKQYELAERLELTATALNYYEKDKRKPGYAVLAKLSRELGYSVDYFLGLEGESADKVRMAVQNEDGSALAKSLKMDTDSFKTNAHALVLSGTEVEYKMGEGERRPEYILWSEIMVQASGQPNGEERQELIVQLLQIIAGCSHKDLNKLLEMAKLLVG